jgi:hypothetical protein
MYANDDAHPMENGHLCNDCYPEEGYQAEDEEEESDD